MWFTANLFFRSQRSDDERGLDDLWEERIILLEASCEEDAIAQAEHIGRHAEHEYLVDSKAGVRVRWAFSGVGRVFSIDEAAISHGTELFSRFLRQSEVESLLRPFEELVNSS